MKLLLSAGFAALILVTPAMAEGDAALGAKIFNKCKTCHENEKGVNRVGPTLKGVVGRKTGTVEKFKYSEAMAAKGGDWSFADLAAFTANPKGYVAGTKMVFNGIPAAADRADLIAYLATLADTPVALPK